jgi:hypothetical protein
MKPLNALSFHRSLNATVLIAIALAALTARGANAASTVLDDFSDAKRNGSDRLLITDKDLGSKSHATQTCEGGVLSVEGELIPGRGVPAFISVPLMLSPDMAPQDMSACQGVRLLVKVKKGILSVQVASADVQNFDFHTSGPVAGKPGAFQEVRIPFKDMKRGWSEQTPLNLKVLTSVNLVAFGLAKDTFAYEVDEIGFY